VVGGGAEWNPPLHLHSTVACTSCGVPCVPLRVLSVSCVFACVSACGGDPPPPACPSLHCSDVMLSVPKLVPWSVRPAYVTDTFSLMSAETSRLAMPVSTPRPSPRGALTPQATAVAGPSGAPGAGHFPGGRMGLPSAGPAPIPGPLGASPLPPPLPPQLPSSPSLQLLPPLSLPLSPPVSLALLGPPSRPPPAAPVPTGAVAEAGPAPLAAGASLSSTATATSPTAALFAASTASTTAAAAQTLAVSGPAAAPAAVVSPGLGPVHGEPEDGGALAGVIAAAKASLSRLRSARPRPSGAVTGPAVGAPLSPAAPPSASPRSQVAAAGLAPAAPTGPRGPSPPAAGAVGVATGEPVLSTRALLGWPALPAPTAVPPAATAAATAAGNADSNTESHDDDAQLRGGALAPAGEGAFSRVSGRPRHDGRPGPMPATVTVGAAASQPTLLGYYNRVGHAVSAGGAGVGASRAGASGAVGAGGRSGRGPGGDEGSGSSRSPRRRDAYGRSLGHASVGGRGLAGEVAPQRGKPLLVGAGGSGGDGGDYSVANVSAPRTPSHSRHVGRRLLS
jgi:hypothetical protein